MCKGKKDCGCGCTDTGYSNFLPESDSGNNNRLITVETNKPVQKIRTFLGEYDFVVPKSNVFVDKARGLIVKNGRPNEPDIVAHDDYFYSNAVGASYPGHGGVVDSLPGQRIAPAPTPPPVTPPSTGRTITPTPPPVQAPVPPVAIIGGVKGAPSGTVGQTTSGTLGSYSLGTPKGGGLGTTLGSLGTTKQPPVSSGTSIGTSTNTKSITPVVGTTLSGKTTGNTIGNLLSSLGGIKQPPAGSGTNSNNILTNTGARIGLTTQPPVQNSSTVTITPGVMDSTVLTPAPEDFRAPVPDTSSGGLGGPIGGGGGMGYDTGGDTGSTMAPVATHMWLYLALAAAVGAGTYLLTHHKKVA